MSGEEGDPTYWASFARLSNGGIGGRHIRRDQDKKEICGLEPRRWETAGLRGQTLEEAYQSHKQASDRQIRHRPGLPRVPCRRCIAAAQKMRPVLERLSDIGLEV